MLQAKALTCMKCQRRLVLTPEGACVLCGFATPTLQDPVGDGSHISPIFAKRTLMGRPDDPISMREAIAQCYHRQGLTRTAIQFGVKPSTLVMRLKRWGVELHGRGWKPGNEPLTIEMPNAGEGKPVASRKYPAAAPGRFSLENVVKQLDELEDVITQTANVESKSIEVKGFQRGRLEMLRLIRVMVRQNV